MKIKLLFLLIFISYAWCYSQLDDKNDSIHTTYKEICKSDKLYQKDSLKRTIVYRENFKKIVEQIEKDGFPNLSNGIFSKKESNTIKKGFYITLTHILQTNPEFILQNNEFIKLIRSEIINGHVSKDLLIIPLSVFYHDSPNIMIDEINFVMENWGIKKTDLIINQ